MSQNLFSYIEYRRRGYKPADALHHAKEKPVSGGYGKFFTPECNVTRQPNRPRYAWVENANAAGLRFVGYADELARSIRHTGWLINDEGWGETYRGAVYRLPHSRGYIAGYADPNNKGAAFVELSLIDSDDETGAAFAANRIAELEAERERDYQRAWHAGQRFRDLADEVAGARKACIALIREARAVCDSLTNAASVKAAIREKIETHCETIREARREREKLQSEFGREAAFNEA